MFNINTGRNPVDSAMAKIDKLIAAGTARDVAHKKGKQGKKQDTKRKPKQLRLGI